MTHGMRSIFLTYGAFALMAFAFLAVVGFAAWATIDARDRSTTNRMLIERLERIERSAADEREKILQTFAHVDKLLCRSLNAERRILADLIRSVIAARETAANRRKATLFFAEALVRLEPRDCDKLPNG